MMKCAPMARPGCEDAGASAATRWVDPALSSNLDEIILQCFEAGASVAYVMHDPRAVVLRDDGDEALKTDAAGTALVVLFRQRSGSTREGGPLRMEVRRPSESGFEENASSPSGDLKSLLG